MSAKIFLVSFEAYGFILHFFNKDHRLSRPIREPVSLSWTNFLIAADNIRCVYTLMHTSGRLKFLGMQSTAPDLNPVSTSFGIPIALIKIKGMSLTSGFSFRRFHT
jgi:hypothetical protein